MHYVDKEQFTAVAWSIEQPNIIFFSGEKGNLEVWDVTKRRSEPIQTQNISGRAINAICPYRTQVTKGNEGHFISVADDSGTLRHSLAFFLTILLFLTPSIAHAVLGIALRVVVYLSSSFSIAIFKYVWSCKSRIVKFFSISSC